jgi:hypothetical protein
MQGVFTLTKGLKDKQRRQTRDEMDKLYEQEKMDNNKCFIPEEMRKK